MAASHNHRELSNDSTYEETHDRSDKGSLVCILGLAGAGVVAIAATVLIAFFCCCNNGKKDDPSNPNPPPGPHDDDKPKVTLTTCGDFFNLEANKQMCGDDTKYTGALDDGTSKCYDASALDLSKFDTTGQSACAAEKCCKKVDAPPQPDPTLPKYLPSQDGTLMAAIEKSDIFTAMLNLKQEQVAAMLEKLTRVSNSQVLTEPKAKAKGNPVFVAPMFPFAQIVKTAGLTSGKVFPLDDSAPTVTSPTEAMQEFATQLAEPNRLAGKGNVQAASDDDLDKFIGAGADEPARKALKDQLRNPLKNFRAARLERDASAVVAALFFGGAAKLKVLGAKLADASAKKADVESAFKAFVDFCGQFDVQDVATGTPGAQKAAIQAKQTAMFPKLTTTKAFFLVLDVFFGIDAPSAGLNAAGNVPATKAKAKALATVLSGSSQQFNDYKNKLTAFDSEKGVYTALDGDGKAALLAEVIDYNVSNSSDAAKELLSAAGQKDVAVPSLAHLIKYNGPDFDLFTAATGQTRAVAVAQSFTQLFGADIANSDMPNAKLWVSPFVAQVSAANAKIRADNGAHDATKDLQPYEIDNLAFMLANESSAKDFDQELHDLQLIELMSKLMAATMKVPKAKGRGTDNKTVLQGLTGKADASSQLTAPTEVRDFQVNPDTGAASGALRPKYNAKKALPSVSVDPTTGAATAANKLFNFDNLEASYFGPFQDATEAFRGFVTVEDADGKALQLGVQQEGATFAKDTVAISLEQLSFLNSNLSLFKRPTSELSAIAGSAGDYKTTADDDAGVAAVKTDNKTFRQVLGNVEEAILNHLEIAVLAGDATGAQAAVSAMAEAASTVFSSDDANNAAAAVLTNGSGAAADADKYVTSKTALYALFGEGSVDGSKITKAINDGFVTAAQTAVGYTAPAPK